MLAYIYPLGSTVGGTPEHPIVIPPGEPGSPTHPIVGSGAPSHPIVLPPLPGVWPKPGEPSHPITLPPEVPGVPSHPVIIPGDPEHPIALPPGSVWPPLPPTTTGKYAILIWVVGVGTRWLVVDTAQLPQPK
jgi:hypothetical protein